MIAKITPPDVKQTHGIPFPSATSRATYQQIMDRGRVLLVEADVIEESEETDYLMCLNCDHQTEDCDRFMRISPSDDRWKFVSGHRSCALSV